MLLSQNPKKFEKYSYFCLFQAIQPTGMDKLFLIDGHSLIFRMYYAFMRRPMINSKGEDMSVLYGFTKVLLDLVRRYSPTHLAVMFDPPAKTFRHELSPGYKANRPPAPELVKSSLEPLSALLSALSVPVVMQPGYEADDVIGTVARMAASAGFEAYMVTPDKDLGQMVGERIYQLKPAKAGGSDEIFDAGRIASEYGISTPSQIIDILTIWGDASDNIKGVEGVGEVGARRLVAKYGSVENIYTRLDELTPRQQEAFRRAEPYIALSKTLATIKDDVPLDIELQDLALRISLSPEASALFDRYEMNSLRSLIPASENTPAASEIPADTAPKALLCTKADLERVVEGCRRKGVAALAPVPGAGAAAPGHGGAVAAPQPGQQLDLWSQLSAEEPSAGSFVVSDGELWAEVDGSSPVLRRLIEDKSLIKTGFGIKDTIKALSAAGLAPGDSWYDVELMHYLINPERSHKPAQILKSLKGLDLEPAEGASRAAADIFSAASQGDEDAPLAAARVAAASAIVAPILRKELEDAGMAPLYDTLELPLASVLADMEKTGVKVRTDILREYSMRLMSELIEIEREARDLIGDPGINLASPRQVGVAIFEKLALGSGRKKGRSDGYSTDEETLSALADKHPFVGKVLEYRALRKMISTYLDPLAAMVDPHTGRIHTTFNQALTATGRLSSSHPNLQNIPIRTDRGREIRKAFVPAEAGGRIVSADYSQIELRLMAELSGEEALIEAFIAGADIHADTASKIFRTPFSEVTQQQRRSAKAVNFGIIYGMSAFGLAQRLGISRSEAKDFIDAYFSHYPKVQEYMLSTVEKGRRDGYVETLYGRRRYLPDIASRNVTVRQNAERTAINAPVQGSAADIIKIAMVRVHERLLKERLRSKMVLQVHDELVIDVAPGECDIVKNLVKGEMEGVCRLRVPLVVDCNDGENWLEAH